MTRRANVNHRRRLELRTAGAWLTAFSALVSSCSSDERSVGPVTHGPPGEILEVDPNAIPSGGARAGASGGPSRPGGGGGSTGSGGHGAGAGGTQAPTSAGNAGRSGASGESAGGRSDASAGGSSVAVGALCESDADCPAPLYCHRDASDYIGHKQCTLDCQSSPECESKLGGQSFCIGARICVDACEKNSECPLHTQCNDGGWCMRGGPGSGVPRCDGPVVICAGLDSTSCALTSGCVDLSSCRGVSTSCYSLYTRSQCTEQDGCYWNSSSERCSGSSPSCSSKYLASSCERVDGCYWSDMCSGTPRRCSEWPPSTCESQPGCRLVFD